MKWAFFQGQGKPYLSDEFDVIGFDMNNGFIKYKELNMVREIIETYLKVLHENFEGYPQSVTEFDYNKHANFSFNNAVWDVQNGTILQLAENCVIKEAWLGFR